MARCNSCSAPLLANTTKCSYCNVRNDIDLTGRHKFSIQRKPSTRICPHCEKPLQTLKLDLNEPFYIERCKTCFGLFFDPDEIEVLLENSVSKTFNTNLQLIQNINKDRYRINQKVKYIKCPICRILMNRVSFGHKSGVIVDKCTKHGIWVESGEITHLMEWKKAGGQLLAAKYKAQTVKKKSRSNNAFNLPSYQQKSKYFEAGLLESVSSFIFHLFID